MRLPTGVGALLTSLAGMQFETWLASGATNVVIPFASVLADLVPPVAVRLRRDFGALLTLIRVHALLHQASRPADEAGRIIAIVEDYAVVRHLVADLLADEVEVSVPAHVREIVEAVRAILAMRETLLESRPGFSQSRNCEAAGPGQSRHQSPRSGCL